MAHALLRVSYTVTYERTNAVALSPRANYTDWATATSQPNLVQTFMDREVSCGQSGGSPTVVNLCFLDSNVTYCNNISVGTKPSLA
jgi:hypothetical protein